VLEPQNVVSLGEGDSALLRLPNLGKELGLTNLFVKEESSNPTGTFKARGLSSAVSKAKELGIRKVIIPTAGNAGGAMAAYAARAGIKAHIFMPKDTPFANIEESRIAGAEVILVDGLISDAAGMAGDLVAMGNILLEKGDADEALTHFAKAKECIKTSSLAKEVKENAEFGYNYNASRAMLAKHSIAEATSFADQVRKGSEAKKNLNQIKLAHELSGLIALSEKKPDVAITELEQSNLQNPYNLFTLAHAYAMSGNPIKAKATMEQAAKFSGLPALNYAFIRVKAEQEWQKM